MGSKIKRSIFVLKVKIFTLYPDLFPGLFNFGLYKKAREQKIWDLEIINIRKYSTNKHANVDDTPFGGGAGMLIRPDILAKSLDSNVDYKKSRKIFFCRQKEKCLIKILQKVYV